MGFFSSKTREGTLLLFLIFVLAFSVRLIAYFIGAEAAEAWDAMEYFARANAIENILTSLLSGHLPTMGDLRIAYTSTWPPLQSVVLGLGLLVFGDDINGARITMVLVSALTAPLVFSVTRRLSCQRASLFAVLAFVFYPTFIHFSLRTFSETTFIFLIFLVLHLLLRLIDPGNSSKRQLMYAGLVGLALGAAILTRAAALVWIPVIFLWILWRSPITNGRVTLAGIALITVTLTLLPWQLAVYGVEKIIVPVTSSSAKNLYLGSIEDLDRDEKLKLAQEYSQQRGVPLNAETYRTLAVQNIVADPIAFVQRGISKLMRLWSWDAYFFRYVITATYPPLDTSFMALLVVLFLVSYALYMPIAIWGLAVRSPSLGFRGLTITLIVIAMLIHFLTISVPRFNVPLQALLLPAVGHGLAHISEFGRRNKRLASLATGFAFLLTCALILHSLSWIFCWTQPSSYYASIAKYPAPKLTSSITFSDRFLIRIHNTPYPGPVTVAIPNQNYLFSRIIGDFLTDEAEAVVINTEKLRSYDWQPARPFEVLSVEAQSTYALEPLVLELSHRQKSNLVAIAPTPEAWQTWHATSIPGVEYMWVGSSQLNSARVKKILEVKGLID